MGALHRGGIATFGKEILPASRTTWYGHHFEVCMLLVAQQRHNMHPLMFSRHHAPVYTDTK